MSETTHGETSKGSSEEAREKLQGNAFARSSGKVDARAYSLSADAVLESQGTAREGLDPAQVEHRRVEFGPNELQEAGKKSIATVFFDQFKDLLIVILIVAAIISAISGNTESTLVIAAVVVLNAVLGTVQTVKAERSLASLKEMSAPVAKVLREGAIVQIPARDVVPGDMLVLEAGDLVAADGRIVEGFSLKVNESALTGESEAVLKDSQIIEAKNVPLGDQANMVFSSSLVTYGRATAVVTAIGMQTELGRVAQLMAQTKQRKTPLQISLDEFSKKLAIGVMAICVLVFLLSVFRSGMDVVDSLMFAVALAVAAIPEALSSIVTIVLAIGTQKMAKEHAVIKDLKAVEALGSVSVICSDKTGTLTQNRMTVQKLYVAGKLVDAADACLDDRLQHELVRIGLLASDAITDEVAGTAIGDPTEVALVQIGDALGIDETAYRAAHPRLAELAFDSDRKLMSTLHLLDETPTLLTKGALDVLLDRTDYILAENGVIPADAAAKGRIMRVNERLSQEGLRVLAFAKRALPDAGEVGFGDEAHYTFVGLAAMMDPPRAESVRAVRDAQGGGIRTVMITGDHRVTATAIARQIGIFQDGDMALDGVELDALSDAELDDVLPRVAVYARVSPEHKIRIVGAWQRRGCIVAMTGDGVNDAPALKKADIGVAMGITGTEVSKDAASMILADDNFATIVKAVVNGRSVYANIKNAVNFLLSGNAAGIICVLFASLAGLAAPFAPVHLLFINLLTDSLPAIAIGMEPARADLLADKPRDPKEPLLNRALATRILGQGVLIAVPTMTAYYIGQSSGGAALAMTMAFATLSLARLFHGFNCRGNATVARLGLGTNRAMLFAFAGGATLLAVALFVPALHSILLVADMTLANVGSVVALAFAPTLVIQAYRSVRDRAHERG